VKALVGWGGAAVTVAVTGAWFLGGSRAVAGALLGGTVALACQVWAVALLKPAMHAPQPVFMSRWLAGIGIRALGLGAALGVGLANRDALPLLAVAGGFLGTLLPLLFAENRFLR
jgi:hypothetical protein